VLTQPGASIPMLLVIVSSLFVTGVYYHRIIRRRHLEVRRASDRFSFFTMGILLIPAILTLPTFIFVEYFETEWVGATSRYVATAILLGATSPIIMDGYRELQVRLRLGRAHVTARFRVARMKRESGVGA